MIRFRNLILVALVAAGLAVVTSYCAACGPLYTEVTKAFLPVNILLLQP